MLRAKLFHSILTSRQKEFLKEIFFVDEKESNPFEHFPQYKEFYFLELVEKDR